MTESFFTRWSRVIRRIPPECRYPNCRCDLTCSRNGRRIQDIRAERRAAYDRDHKKLCPHGVRGWIYCSSCNSD